MISQFQSNYTNQNQYSFAQISSKLKAKDDDSAPKGITESKARSIIQDEFKKLDESIKTQNEKVLEIINNATEENKKMLNESVKNLTTVVDKMVYHMDKRLSRLNEQLEENIYQTEEMSFIILEDQLEKKKEELLDVETRIKQLKNELPLFSGECDKYFSCTECMQNKKCGWCSMEERCVLGDVDGPLYVSCNFYNYQYCAGRECSKYTSCSHCLSDPQCGWCLDKERELAGCLEQPGDYQGCPEWYHIESNRQKCPKVLLPFEIEEQPTYNIEEDWARQDEKQQKKKSKKQLREEQQLYEEELKRVKDERQKQIESVTPTEKKEIYKKKQDEMKELEGRVKHLKKTVKKLQSRYDDMVLRMREFSDDDMSEPDIDPEQKGEDDGSGKEED